MDCLLRALALLCSHLRTVNFGGLWASELVNLSLGPRTFWSVASRGLVGIVLWKLGGGVAVGRWTEGGVQGRAGHRVPEGCSAGG